MTDIGEDCFKFVHYNVSTNDMNKGKMGYVKFGKVGLKSLVSLSHGNICLGFINVCGFA